MPQFGIITRILVSLFGNGMKLHPEKISKKRLTPREISGMLSSDNRIENEKKNYHHRRSERTWARNF